MKDYVKKCLILLDIVILLVAFPAYVILSANGDTAPPLWRNQKQSAFVTSQGEYVEIGIQTVTLNTGEPKVLTFRWSTTGVTLGNYTFRAAAAPVPNEINIEDNVYILDYPVTVIPELTTVMLLTAIMISLFIAVTR